MHLLRQTRQTKCIYSTNQEGAVFSLMNQEANASTPTNQEGAVL